MSNPMSLSLLRSGSLGLAPAYVGVPHPMSPAHFDTDRSFVDAWLKRFDAARFPIPERHT